MQPFLKSVAEAYTDNYGLNELHSVLFVFPNKRAGTFFLNHLKNVARRRGVGILAPAVMGVSEWIEDVSGLVTDSRVNLLFRLYNTYRSVVNRMSEKSGKKGIVSDFDRFCKWGETVLSDFNDVDMYMVDADDLFSNLNDYKSISTDFLTDEQKEVMLDYFGLEPDREMLPTFWEHYNNPNDKGDVKRRFIKLWNVMGTIYKEFRLELEKDGLAYTGQAYRRAYQVLSDPEKLPGTLPYKRVVMVGFNALSTVEYNIFKVLRDAVYTDGNGNEQPLADFYWDHPSLFIGERPDVDPDGFYNSSAGHFIDKDIEKFPSLYDISSCMATKFPEVMEVCSSPSDTGQVKIACSQIENIIRDDAAGNGRGNSNTEKENVAVPESLLEKIAVVLPEEKLLPSLLYGMPSAVDKVNITMGFSMRFATPYILSVYLRRLQARKSYSRNLCCFLREDVEAVLANPLIGMLVSQAEREKILEAVRMLRSIVVPVDVILENCGQNKNVTVIFRDVREKDTSFTVIDWVDGIMALLQVEFNRLEKDSEGNGEIAAEIDEEPEETPVDYSFDLSQIKIFRNTMALLKRQMNIFGIEASSMGIFSLLEKLLAGETISFNGEPLEGLQVMGPLETRCLDFEYVVIPSMNEGVYPRKSRSRSFIPNALRYAYGMATNRFQESIYSYNFYRLISRAKRVYMIYDSRVNGLNVPTGGVSRYILQLRHLYNLEGLDEAVYRFGTVKKNPRRVEVLKDENVMEHIDEFFTKGSKFRFSASSLTTYCQCKLRFYLEEVRKIKKPDEKEVYLSAASQGNVMHRVLELIYSGNLSGEGGKTPFVVTEGYLKEIIANQSALKAMVKSAIENELWGKDFDSTRHRLNDFFNLYIDMMSRMVENVLKSDIARCPIEVRNVESSEVQQLPLPSGKKANMVFKIDRVDQPSGANLRIVDYKTGKSNTIYTSIGDIFENMADNHVAFQLILYAYLYSLYHGIETDIDMEIYNLVELNTSKKSVNASKGSTNYKGGKLTLKEPKPGKDGSKKVQYDYVEQTLSQVNSGNAFVDKLFSIIEEIADKEVSFSQCREGSAICAYCPFRNSICQR